MARRFGTGPYGTDRYSRGTFRGIVSIRAAARVAIVARLKAAGGWDVLPVPPCDIWDPLPTLPCEGAWDGAGGDCASWLPLPPAGGIWAAIADAPSSWAAVPAAPGAWAAIGRDLSVWIPTAEPSGDAWAAIGAEMGSWMPVPATPRGGSWVTL